MSFYNPIESKLLYEDYLRTEDETLLGKLIQSVEGLVDSVIYKEFMGYDVNLRAEYRQDAYLLLIELFRNKYIKLDGNYTSFLYECIKGHILKKIKKDYQIFGDTIDEDIQTELNDSPICYETNDFVNRDYIQHLKFKINRIYRQVEPEYQPLCKFMCHYFVSKKDLPALALVKTKFKQSHLAAIYQSLRVRIKEQILQFKLRYYQGED